MRWAFFFGQPPQSGGVSRKLDITFAGCWGYLCGKRQIRVAVCRRSVKMGMSKNKTVTVNYPGSPGKGVALRRIQREIPTPSVSCRKHDSTFVPIGFQVHPVSLILDWLTWLLCGLGWQFPLLDGMSAVSRRYRQRSASRLPGVANVGWISPPLVMERLFGPPGLCVACGSVALGRGGGGEGPPPRPWIAPFIAHGLLGRATTGWGRRRRIPA